METQAFTVADALNYWLQDRQGQVKTTTLCSYRQISRYVVHPILIGSASDRKKLSRYGLAPPQAEFAATLGGISVADLTTGQMRAWQKLVSDLVSPFTARVANKVLSSALSLAAEDFGVRVAPMPRRTGRGRPKPKKLLLTKHEIGRVLSAAAADKFKGLYYAFPFLAGTRPSEQLALIWEDINFEQGVIHVRRMQETSGHVCNLTKSAAGHRDIPMSSLLRAMLANWKQVCPSGSNRSPVFPALGRLGRRYRRNDKPLTYQNFRVTYWRPMLLALSLPMVTPHSARHAFISTLQAEGVEIGLVAKLAGHSDPSVTLAYYTHAMRGGEAAVETLVRAFDKRNLAN